MKRAISLVLTLGLTAAFIAPPAQAAAKKSCCGSSCPMPKAPMPCCQVAPAQQPIQAASTQAPVFAAAFSADFSDVLLISSEAPPSAVFARAIDVLARGPSGLSPPAVS